MKMLWIIPLLSVIAAIGMWSIFKGEVRGAPQAAEMYAMMTATVLIPFVFVRAIEGLASGIATKKKE